MSKSKTNHSRASKGEMFWQKHIERWRSSDLNQSQYCQQQGLSLSSFTKWKQRFNKPHQEQYQSSLEPSPFIEIPQDSSEEQTADEVVVQIRSVKVIYNQSTNIDLFTSVVSILEKAL